jgi:hypothetical protein
MMLDGIVLRLETEEAYRKALHDLEEWMRHDDRPAPPHIESLIQALVRYEEKHFPMKWEGKR